MNSPRFDVLAVCTPYIAPFFETLEPQGLLVEAIFAICLMRVRVAGQAESSNLMLETLLFPGRNCLVYVV